MVDVLFTAASGVGFSPGVGNMRAPRLALSTLEVGDEVLPGDVVATISVINPGLGTWTFVLVDDAGDVFDIDGDELLAGEEIGNDETSPVIVIMAANGPKTVSQTFTLTKGDGLVYAVLEDLQAHQRPLLGGANVVHAGAAIGQSLGIGAGGFPLQSTTALYSTLRMLVGGPKATKSGNSFGGVNQSAMDSLVPLVENDGNPDGSGISRGETNGSGMGSALISQAVRSGVDPTTINFLWAAVGKGDTVLSNLVVGSAWDQNRIDNFNSMKTLVELEGKTIHQTFMKIAHGQANSSDTRTAYRSSMNTAINNWQASYLSLNPGQTVRPHTIVHQQSWGLESFATNLGGPPLALLDLGTLRDDVSMGMPLYMMSYSDGAHLGAYGYLWCGLYEGKIAKTVLIDGKKPLHLRLNNVTRDGLEVRVKLDVPVGPLRFDTTTLPATQDMGFAFRTDDGYSTLTSVAIDGEYVVLMLSELPTGANERVRYALDYLAPGLSGPKYSGNLRDSDPTWEARNGNIYRLHNWLHHTERAVGYQYNQYHPLLLNQEFDTDTAWTKGTGWTISGGVAPRTNTGGQSTLTQSIAVTDEHIMEIGTTYAGEFKLATRTGGSVDLRLFGVGIGLAHQVLTPYPFEFVATAPTMSGIGIIGSSSFAGSVDYFRVAKKVV